MIKLTDDQMRKVTKGQPKNRYPKKIEDWYRIKLTQLVNSWKKVVVSYSKDWLKPYVKGGALVMDADDDDDDQWMTRFIQLFEQMTWAVTVKQRNQQLKDLADQYVQLLSYYGFEQSKAQMAVHGLNPIEHDATLDNYATAKVAENTTLIQSLRDDYISSIQKDVYQSITKGGTAGQLADIIQKRTRMAVARAQLIATDQTGTIISQVNAYRAKKAGAKKYIWHSVEDQRVRPLHQKLDNTVQTYGDPNGGDHGQLPGEPIRCRCYAEPIYDLEPLQLALNIDLNMS